MLIYVVDTGSPVGGGVFVIPMTKICSFITGVINLVIVQMPNRYTDSVLVPFAVWVTGL